MKLYKLTPEEIADFILNGKTSDCIELKVSSPKDKKRDTGFTDIIVYKDKYMEIQYSYLETEEYDVIENIYITSNWWGRIKNSFFTIQGERGKFDSPRCGWVVDLQDMKSNFSERVTINNTNKIYDMKTQVNNFASFVMYMQKNHKQSPTYKVIKVVSESPRPWVAIEITIPGFGTYHAGGASKKAAADDFITTLLSREGSIEESLRFFNNLENKVKA